MKNLFLILVVVSLSGYGQTATDYFNKGISKFNLKDYQGAISEFNKSIHLNPNDADAYINRGIAKKKLLEYTGADAISDYNIAIQLNPNNSDYFYNRGNAKIGLRDYRGAITDFSIAIQLNPDNADAFTMKEDAKKQLQNYTGIPSLYQAGLYLKQSANLNIASLLIMGLGTGVSFLLPPSGQLPVIASIGLGASITSIISIIKKKKAGKELMLVNMK